MKKLYTITLSLLFGVNLTAQSQLGEIVNGGFENWTTTTIYENPSVWQSTNTQEFRGIALVSKSTDASAGTYSVKLETYVDAQDTMQSYVFHGGVGQNGPDKGIPYNSTFSDVVVSYKSDLLGTDTLHMMMIRFAMGNMVGMDLVPVAVGQNASWVRDTIPVSAGIQDSLFIGFIVGNVDGPANVTNGSWALVDDVKLVNNGVAVADLPNQSFENWDAATVEEPDNWYTLNTMLVGMQLNNANKTIDAYAGSYAIEMTTVQPSGFGGDTIPSFVSMGVIDFSGQGGGSPFLPVSYGATPGTFSGAYKYSPVNGDQAGIIIQFMQGGNLIGQHGENFSQQSTYTTFSSPLTITGTPDSIIFLVSSGSNPGSVLKIDELQFTGGDVGVEEMSQEEVVIYPNPATDYVNINGQNFDFFIYDITGKTVTRKVGVTGKQTINVSEYTRGTYFVKIVEGESVVTKKLIVQ